MSNAVFKLITVIAAGALSAGAIAAPSTMQAGAWKMQTRISALNPETGAYTVVNESTTTLCLSPEFLARDPYLTPNIDEAKMQQRQMSCTLSEAQREQASASWKMNCTTADGSALESRIKNSTSPKGVTSETETTVKRGEATQVVRMVLEGSFAGECTSDMLKP